MSDQVTKAQKDRAMQVWKAADPIRKADITQQFLSGNGAYLLETQLMQVIRIMQKKAAILGVADVMPMNSHTMRLDTMRFNTEVLSRGNACDTTTPVTPDLGKPQLHAAEFVAQTKMSYDALEEALGGPDDFVDNLLTSLAGACAADLERVIINSDTASLDPKYNAWDGMLASAVSHIHNAASSNFSATVADAMINLMPDEFRSNHTDLRFFLDRNSDQFARSANAARATEYGDSQLTSHQPVQFYGVNLLPGDVWPKTLGLLNNETEVILTAPDNIKVGIRRDMRIEQEVKPTARCIVYVISFRAAFVYLEEDAVVKATEVVVV